jgi:hypothetical protein
MPLLSDFNAAESAGIEEMLRRWVNPFPSDPHSVHNELRDMKLPIEARNASQAFFESMRGLANLLSR